MCLVAFSRVSVSESDLHAAARRETTRPSLRTLEGRSRMSRQWIAVIAALIVFPAAVASAQPLADRVPADALVYVGWSGSQNLGPAYDASHLKAIAASSDVQKLFTETFPALARRAGAGNA